MSHFVTTDYQHMKKIYETPVDGIKLAHIFQAIFFV
jgi:hypothetical protein